MQRTAIRVWRQVVGALVAIEPEALGLLEQKRRPQIRTFAAI